MQPPAYQSCIACLKGDTTTVLALKGEGEFLMAAMQKIGVTEQDSRRLVLNAAQEHYGCTPGHLPVVDMEMLIRVCTDCGHKGGFEPGPEGAVPLYEQPDEWRMPSTHNENPPWQ
jgi:hypothetical protein